MGIVMQDKGHMTELRQRETFGLLIFLVCSNARDMGVCNVWKCHATYEISICFFIGHANLFRLSKRYIFAV